MKKYLLLILLSLLLTACGSAEPTLNPTEGARLLAGDYVTTITAADVESFESLDDLSGNQGTWLFSLDDAGKFIATLEGREFAQGTYTVKGNEAEIYISNTVDDDSCLRQIGRFTWSLKEDELRFTKVAGMCDGMILILTSHPLLRQP